jgi:tetratricopeptide (TPR) repeat protein
MRLIVLAVAVLGSRPYRSMRLLGLATLLLFATCAFARAPDFEALIALRTSEGFREVVRISEARLSENPEDGVAAGARAVAYGNAVDFMGMTTPAQMRSAATAKQMSLDLAMRTDPAGPWSRAAYGLIHMFDNTKRAEMELQSCIAEHPAFLECYNLYGVLLRKTGRLEEAGPVYLRGLQRQPSDGRLIIGYAIYLEESGRFKEAVRVLQNLVKESPSFARAHWHLATTLFDTGGDLVLARQEAVKALALDPLIWSGDRFLKIIDGTASY